MPPVAGAGAEDLGAADPAVLAALLAAAGNPAARPALIAALRDSRLLIAVVADQIPNEMALVTLHRPDGREALPAFTSVEALAGWNPQARPLPRTVRELARDCLTHNYSALLLDLGLPHAAALTGIELVALAAEG